MAAPKTKEDAPERAEFVTVKSANEGRVGIWEVDPAHKAAGHTNEKTGLDDGEIFVTDKPTRVAKTALVNLRLRDGLLVETSAKGEVKESGE